MRYTTILFSQYAAVLPILHVIYVKVPSTQIRLFGAGTVSIEDAGIILPGVLHLMPGYKKLSQKYSRFDRRINFFWHKNNKRYLKKEIAPTSRDILLNRKSIVSDEELWKHIEYSKRRGLKGTKGLPIYGRISKGIFLLDGNHRRYLLHEAGVKMMKVWMADLERFWKDFKKDISSMSDVVRGR